MRDYSKVENCLKSFLKNNKRLGYSVALLVTFLINGGFSYADEVIQASPRVEIKNKIEKEQENISQMLKDADNSINDIELKMKKLLQRGAFWVKPLEDSYQVFFNGSWGNKTKNRNRTEQNFNGAEYASSSSTQGSGLTYGQYYKGRYYGQYGIIKNPLEFVDNIDFGANITPKSVTEKVITEKSVSVKEITLPTAAAPTIKIDEIKSTVVSTPDINPLATPAAPSINVTAPGTVPTLGSITVGAISPLNITVNPPSPGNPPEINAPTVQTPATPGGFNPRIISLPEVADREVVISPVPDPPATDVAYQDVPNNLTGYNKNNSLSNNGLLSQLDINSGTYNVYFRGFGSSNDFSFENATATPFTPSPGGLALPSNDNGSFSKVAFYGIGGKALATIPSSVTLNIIGNNTGGAINTVYYLGNNSSAGNPESKIINEGTVNMYGNKIVVANIDNVSSPGNITFVNKGKITGYAERGSFNGNQGHADVGNFIFGGYSYGDKGTDTIENGTGGNVTFYAPSSVGWAYTSSATQPVPRKSINNGIMKLYGHHSLGVATDNDATSTQMAYALITLNNPIEVLGDQSVGASIKTQPDTSSTNFDNSTWNIQLGDLGGTTQNIIYGDKINKNGIQISGNTAKVEQSVGLNFDFTHPNSGTLRDITIKKYKVDMKTDVLNSTGIRVAKAHLVFDTNDNFSKLNLDGENNVGFLADGGDAVLTYNNTRAEAITLGSTNKGNILFAAINMGKLNIKEKFSLGIPVSSGEGFIPFYVNGSNSKITLEKGIAINHSGKNSIIAYAKGTGEIAMTNTTFTLPNIPSISTIVNNTEFSSFDNSIIGDRTVAFYTDTAGKLKADNSKIKVEGGSALAYSKGASSKIEIKNSLLDYSGEGYAIYTKDGGTIDMSNSVLALRGKAVGMKVADITSGKIITGTSKIVMMSNDAIPFDVSNVGTVNVDDIATGLGIPSTLMVVKGQEGTTVYNKYKKAYIDGIGNLNINQDLDKTYATDDKYEASTNLSEKSSYDLFRRYLIQKAVVNIKANKKVVAHLDNAKLVAMDTQNVVGLEMNSSSSATSNNATAIKLEAGSSISADRTDGGAGAVGAFINYGQVNVDATAKILVEKEANTVNNGAVGVYAVNGSKVTNNGTIEVGGEQSIGILGMAYRTDASNKLVVDEFGSKAVGQGLVTITNGKDIKLTGDNTTGIFALNNNIAKDKTNHTIRNTGTITIGKSTGINTAIGIYGDKVTVKPEGGTIEVGEKAVGIYAKDSDVGEASKNLGKIKYGTAAKGAVGIYLKGSTRLLGNEIKLEQDGTAELKGKIGILAELDNDATISAKIDTGTVNDIIAYYTNKNNLGVAADLNLNKNSIGISGATGKNLVYGDVGVAHTLRVGENSTGISSVDTGTDGSNITVKKDSTIELDGKNAIGVYKSRTGTGSSTVNYDGKVLLKNSNTIGIYADKSEIMPTNTFTADFSNTNAKNSIGIFLEGSIWSGANTGITSFTSDHSKGNIYIYAQGSKDGASSKESNLNVLNTFKVNPSGSPTATSRTIGIYLDTAVKGDATKFVNNSVTVGNSTAKIEVEGKGIAIYSKNTSNDNENIINRPNITSTSKETVGIYTDGNIKLADVASDGGTIKAIDGGIGIYATNSDNSKSTKVNIVGTHNVETTKGGTGIYLTNKSYLSGGILNLKNNTSGTPAAGVYYTKGNSTSTVEHKTELKVADGNELLALYVDGGIDLKNSQNISITKGEKNIGAFITGNSKFTNGSEINVAGTAADFKSGIGTYVISGEAINDTAKKIIINDSNGTANTLSVGMAADKDSKATAAKITNKGTISITGDAIGMSVDNGAVATNSGTIEAKNNSTLKAIGAYIKGNTSAFVGKGGTISSENVALALDNTGLNKIEGTGTLELTRDNAVGVYAKDAVVDFDVITTTNADKTVALYAQGNTKIGKKVTSSSGAGHIGVYVADNKVTFEKGSSVVVSNGKNNDFGIGIYTKAGYDGLIKTDISQAGEKTIGLFLGADATTGSKVKHEGTINVGTGIGAYIPEKSEFIAQNTTFNVNKGVAIYLKGGKVDLGKTGTAKIAFGSDGGTAIFQDGGDIVTGSNLTITGSGSFLSLKNANSSINSVVKVGKKGIGINGIYDKAGTYAITLNSPNGKIELDGDEATGMAASSTVNTVNVVNKGTIITVSGEKTVGIFGRGVNIKNEAGAKINIGAKGVGIYTTNDKGATNTDLINSGDINLIGDSAIGILASDVNTNKDITVGKITGTKDGLTGVYVKDSKQATTVKDFTINLGNNGRGLVFENGKDFTVTSSTTNKVAVGTTTGTSRGIGIAAIGTSGTVSKTELTVGANKSIGLYAKNASLTFDLTSGGLKSTDGSSILAYADKAGSKIALNGGGTLSVGANGIGIGTEQGQIAADKLVNVEVNGANGMGAYIKNGGSISNNFQIKVKNSSGIGVYATGNVTALPKVTELKGSNSKAYVLENVTNTVTIANPLVLNDASATGTVGILAQGSGSGLVLNGISIVGSENTGVFSSTGKTVINNGTLTVGDSTKSSIGIYSKSGAVTNNGNMIVGKNSLGIYTEKTGVTVTGDTAVNSNGVGIYVKNVTGAEGNVSLGGKLTVQPNAAIGVQVDNAKVSLTKDLDVGANDSKGIFSVGTGDIETNGNITVGKDSVGIYKVGTGTQEVKTVAGTAMTVADNAYGVFVKNAKVSNNSNITVGKDGIGVYVDVGSLTSVGNITVADKGIGLLQKGSGTLTSTGALTVGSNNAIGIYANGANISQSGNITVADKDGIGIYSKGAGSVTTNGNIVVGNDSIGIYKEGTGTMTIGAAGQTLKIGEKGYGIYYKGIGSGAINSNMNMTLAKESVGIYAKNTTVNQIGDITVGETTIGANGYNAPSENKNSIGVFGENSNVTYKGNMLVEKPLSVGLYAINGGSITLKTGSTLTVKNGGIGIMTGKGVNTITIENGAIINVDGKATGKGATEKNTSFGITAYSGDIHNNGTINITNGATGIYVGGSAILKSNGTLNIDASSTGVGRPTTKESAELGGIKVTDKGVVTIGNKVITGGTVNIKGDLNMAGMGIDISTGKTIIDAKSITGTAYVTPDFSTGSSQQKITIKDVFKTSPGGIGDFTGEVKSKSVSWIAKISKDPNDTTTTTKDITMVRLPYYSLISGERYKNLAGGLENIRQKGPANEGSAIFKSLDKITSHGEFAKAIANIRGDVYANIQERMKTVESSFDKSYNELLDSYNLTRDVNKFSVIYTKGKHEDNTFGVTSYKYNSMGVLYLNDREGFTYGEKFGWSAGIVGSNFDFDGNTNKGSKERVVSGKVGLHYQKALNSNDDNARMKWLSRLELTVNNHRVKRNSEIGTETYRNKAKFYSTDLSLKNKISYDYDISTRWTLKPYVGVDLSYGHIFNISETGEGLKLDIKGKDYFVISPNIGVETKYVLPLAGTHQLVTKADAKVSYDITELYKDTNMAKLKDSGQGYYKLSEPERRRARVATGIEIGVEKENTYGITFRTEYSGYKKKDLNYGVRFNYKF